MVTSSGNLISANQNLDATFKIQSHEGRPSFYPQPQSLGGPVRRLQKERLVG